MKIVLDFDDTILNTKELIDKFAEVFIGAGFTEKEFNIAYERVKEIVGEFDLEAIIELLARLKLFDKDKVRKKSHFIIDNIRNFVYPDFFNFAKEFSRENLILLSIAQTNFQRVKIGKAGVAPFFSEVIVTMEDKVQEMASIRKKHPKETIFLLDDKIDQIEKVKTELPDIIAMKMERGGGAFTNKKPELVDFVIKNFDEARSIIDKKL